jgi:hypothetical protein
MSYEIAKEYVAEIGEDNITSAHLEEWTVKLIAETDTLKKKFIRDHITVISNIIHSREQ